MPGSDVVTLDLYGQPGQCRLTLSGANLLLSPYNGNRIRINGVLYTIPAGGISLSASGATANTTYFIYVYDNNGLTLERSTTGHVTNSNGDEVKSGDATRTLVGMARAVTGPAWVDSASQRFVLSWFNKRPLRLFNQLAGQIYVTSQTFVELDTTNGRVEFLTWPNEAVDVSYGGGAFNTNGALVLAATGFDGTTAERNINRQDGSSVGSVGSRVVTTLSEGYHYATLLGSIGNGGTGTAQFEGSTSGSDCYIITGSVLG